ncbi:N-6 DNA methylase [Haloplanus halophilus]|uniref:N-6 DNA methylase n=1 Tax=Haloplanus halophilus TaxID=2949993 RepID=UPI00203F6F36|nr:N-6 DNA methylase [Haloplanus sp. GDY1]
MTTPSGDLSPTEVRILSALRNQKEIDGPGWGLGNPLYFRQTTDLEKGEVEYALQKLVEKGYIARVNRGLYCINTDENAVFELNRPTPDTGVQPQDFKSSGHEPTQVYTPARIARFLTDWAVRQGRTSVLEPTVGSGNIAKQICRRKFDLGANPETVETTVFGREVDEDAVNKLKERIHREFEISLPGISAGDIFAYDGPMVEAIVGNPPYAGASNFSLPDSVKTRFTEKYGFNGNTDLYCYVTAHVTQYLESGGRLAVVLSNSWLRKRYGTEFKQFLFSEYDIRAIIGFEHTTFDAGTNPVCLLAERSEESSGDSQEIEFIQLRDEAELVGAETIDELRKQAMLPSVESPVNPDDNFDELLRAPELIEYIRNDSLFTELETVANVRIGLQTLAKEFYTFDPEKESSSSPSLAEKYKQPFAHSPSNFESPRITGDNADRKLLDIDETDVANQNSAAEYVEWGENREVGQRNTDETFTGYNEKPRIKGANRDPWYDLSDEKTKCTGPVLLPRRIYKAYTAYWNQDQIVANENFLIVTPNDASTTESLLAFLNSTLGEVCVRLSGQVYGGGVCELSVTGAKSIACPEFDHLNSDAHELLSKSFNTFLDTQNREQLDQTVYETLGLPDSVRSLIEDTAAKSLREVAVK